MPESSSHQSLGTFQCGIVAITTAATARNFAIARISALIVRAPRAPAVRWLANISDISSSKNVDVLLLACPAECRHGLAWNLNFSCVLYNVVSTIAATNPQLISLPCPQP